MSVEIITQVNLGNCPKCGTATTICRHPYSRVWCPRCGHVLRDEGDRTIRHELPEIEKEGARK